MLKVGTGRVFVLASSYPLSNAGLGDADNGAFIYNLVQMSGGTSVAFDEAHHAASTGGDLVGLLTVRLALVRRHLAEAVAEGVDREVGLGVVEDAAEPDNRAGMPIQ